MSAWTSTPAYATAMARMVSKVAKSAEQQHGKAIKMIERTNHSAIGEMELDSVLEAMDFYHLDTILVNDVGDFEAFADTAARELDSFLFS